MREVDDLVGAELEALPMPRAPRSLLPRVMAAVAAAERAPWYARAWVTWPRGWQLASAAMLVAIAAGVWQWGPAGREWIAAALTPAPDAADRVSMLPGWAAQIATLGRVLWGVLFAPIAIYFAALAIAAALAAAAFWAAINRLALGGAPLR